MQLRRGAAITGYADLPSTRTPDGRTGMGLTFEMARLLLADSGLEKGEIDGLLVAAPFDDFSMFWPGIVAENLGLKLKYLDTVELGGATAAGMTWRAAAAIEAGLCNHVMCITVDVIARATTPWLSILPRHDKEFEIPIGAMPGNTPYAMIAQRHMYEFGTKPEQLAKISVSQRANALLTPGALFGETPLTVDEVLASKMICSPLHVLEIVSSCSGGAGLIVSNKAAYKGPNPPVTLIGAGEAGSHVSVTIKPDVTTSFAKDSGERAFAMAGLKPSDMDFAQLYDCYTIAVLMFLEDLGFAKKGQGGAFVGETDMTWAGDFPVNTNGGQLSYGQPGPGGGMIHVVEAARQLMGRAGPRQIKGASKGVAHGNGGIMSDEVTLILAN